MHTNYSTLKDEELLIQAAFENAQRGDALIAELMKRVATAIDEQHEDAKDSAGHIAELEANTKVLEGQLETLSAEFDKLLEEKISLEADIQNLQDQLAMLA